MLWFRQCCALMRKNRLIKCRKWGSTIAEVLLPVFIMLVMVGIRAAVTKDDKQVDLHYQEPTPLTSDQLALAQDAKVFVMNGSIVDGQTGPIAWDARSAAQYFFNGTKAGMQSVNTIQFLPNGRPEVLQMASDFRTAFPELADHVETRFASDDELHQYVRGSDYATTKENAAIAVAVYVTSFGPAWNYVIRGNTTQNSERASTLATEESTVNTLQVVYDEQNFPILLGRGHALMQDFVENWILTKVTGKTFSRSYTYQPFPTPPYVYDSFADVISAVLGLFFTIIYMWPVTRLVKGIVEEKQLRIKEGMRMMGLPDSALFCSWFGTYVIMFFITSLLITIVTVGNVYPKSNPVYIFLFFFFFALSTFAFCWFLSVFFSRSQVATTFSALLFLGIFFPYFAVTGSSHSQGEKVLASLSSPICFALGAVAIQKLESQSTGANVHTASVLIDNWSYNNTITLLIVDFILYILLGLYFQQVIPSEWGTHQRWYFLCQPRWWCPKKVQANTGTRAKSLQHLHQQEEDGALQLHAIPHSQLQEGDHLVAEGERNKDSYFEPVAESLQAQLGVSIQNLRKIFPTEDGEPFVAVRGMNLDLYSGQILALLGHNGAGKTTTINMLSGMIAPSSGDAFVYGESITENMSSVRKILGVVPQHNILYDLLSVKEHLELFCAIKGVPVDETESQINEMIAQVGLVEKVNDKSAALSGGMQRKLSVAIALIGDSKIVFLDEPTSGMDPYSRRATWDLLKKKKEGRVMILTTHFMDEADYLGDRVAIMAKGDVKCCGSSLFLKNRYGVGYTLTIVKANGFQESVVRELIHQSVPDVTPLSNIAAEISFRLPFQSSSHFADVFDQFDSRQQELGIDSYGISVTTLEEVFLRVGHEDDAHPEAIEAQKKTLKEAQRKLSMSQNGPRGQPVDIYDMPDKQPELIINNDASVSSPSNGSNGGMQTVNVKSNGSADGNGTTAIATNGEKKKGLSNRAHSSHFANLRIPGEEVNMFPIHFRALLIKRLINAKRDRKVWTWTLLYPFLILLVGCGLIQLTNVTSHPEVAFNNENLKQDGNKAWVPFVTLNAGNTLFQKPAYATTTFEDKSGSIGQSGLDGNSSAMNRLLLDDLYPTPHQAYSRYNGYYSNFQQSGSANNYIDNFVVFFNTSCQWAASYGLTQYNNQILQALGFQDTTINLSIHPFPQTLNQQTLTNSLTAVIVAIGFAFMPANFIAYAVKEEQDKVKHQQLISGVSAVSYWSANYVWDFCNYMVMGLLCLLIFRIWSIPQLIGSNTGAVFLAIILYGFSIIPFNYIASFMFTESTSAQNTMLLFYIFCGALLLIATIVLDIIESTKNAAYYIKFICRLIPSYSFGEAIVNIIVRESSTAFGSARGIWDIEVTGYPMIFMTWEIFVYSAFVIIYEKVKATPSLMAKIFGNPEVAAVNVPDEDQDVINEKTRLQGGSGQNDMIKITGLRKVYKGRLGGGNKIAVQDLWLGIPEGQCLGFLGINGAGKTTTLKMLTGDILPTSGTGTLNNLDILTDQMEVRRLLGYCPQFDALIDTLTAREHLMLFARIKGVPEEILADYVEHLILKLGLQEGIADKPSKGYSGGNKRKLCVGMALIGNPPIVFLDEPSTGMDPGSRRFMWDLIASTMKHRSVILTTHSMEECEALCHRTAIMVGGRLRCLGSTSHLKSVYGAGYQLDVNVSEQHVVEFRKHLEETWEHVTIIEEHGNNLKFRLPKEAHNQKTSIGGVFRFMEACKQQFDLHDYSVSETTLEQIFIHFAKQQEEETGAVAGIQK